MRTISYDYIRIRNHYDGKEFRNLGSGNNENHFFGDKTIWKSFKNKHSSIVRNLPKEPEINFDSINIKSHLDDRDNRFFTKDFLDNLEEHKDSIKNNKETDAPEKLVKRAATTFDAIKKRHRSFAEPDVQNLTKELGEKVFASLLENSPSRVLSHIIGLLEKIDVDKIPKNEFDDVIEKTKRIQQLGYRINKEL